jgi:lipid-A-disaccharide synthase
MTPKRIMLVAGEASGDMLAAELVEAMRTEASATNRPTPFFFGAGGPRMSLSGVKLAVDLTEHAVVGIWEVVRHYRKFRRLFHQLLDLAHDHKPDVVILVDYPGFNLRFAKALKESSRRRASAWNPRIVYYVSPQLWAWHESRVHQIARDVDLLLSIFPFEKDWYATRARQLHVEFVGHPILDRYSRDRGTTEFFRQTAGNLRLPPAPLILLLPGSRVRELKKHLPPMLDAAARIQKGRHIQFRMVVPGESLAELARRFLVDGAPPIELLVGGLPEVLPKAQLAIASSGTVSLECAFFGVPSVILYRTSWSTYHLGRRFIKVPYLAMPNILANEAVYPEFIQNAATGDNLARESLDLLKNAQRRDSVRTRLARVIQSLGEPGASRRAAAAVWKLLHDDSTAPTKLPPTGP